jgi:hypothetical protein
VTGPLRQTMSQDQHVVRHAKQLQDERRPLDSD